MDFLSAKSYIDGLNKYGSVLGLDNMKSLLDELDNPQDKLKVIHVAGTNGKGSTISYMESILLKAGYTCGKYTSPVVFDYLEKYQLNGEYITENDYSMLVEKISLCIESLNSRNIYPTIFEVETAMAYLYFLIKKPDIVIVETGMGGDTDATNVCKKVSLSVITSISYDHMAFLGDTIEEIATHKAGIIKEGCPVVINGENVIARKVIVDIAKKLNAPIVIASKLTDAITDIEQNDYGNDKLLIGDYKSANGIVYNNLRSVMCGEYQKENIALAIEAISQLSIYDEYFARANEYISEGIASASLCGRFEKVCDKPLMYIDGAHNPDAVIKLKKTIEAKYKEQTITFIMGVLADKDYEEECREIASLADYIITITPNNQRALSGDKLRDTVVKYNKNVKYIEDMKTAINEAVSYGTDIIIAFGSLSYLGEFKRTLKEIL